MEKIAIIGTGMAGMSAAYFLNSEYDISVFDNAPYVGGHTNTINVDHEIESTSFDTGFMVFNQQTYPLMTKLFKKLNVPIQKTNMSFSVQNTTKNLEFSGSSFNHLFAQRKNLFRPRYFQFLWQIYRFNQLANQAINENHELQGQTIADFCHIHKLSKDFLNDYLIPMSSAVWSTPPDRMLEFPIITLIRFFYNHGFLGMKTHHQWYTVTGGSRQYRNRLIADFADKIHINTDIRHVIQNPKEVEIHFEHKASEKFDKVIFACHADTALALLLNPSEEQKNIIESFKYQKNIATIHSDESVMPKTELAWASWNYRYDLVGGQLRNCTIYYMNRLQDLKTKLNYFVSINDPGLIDPKKIYRVIEYTHPLFDQSAIAAQTQIDQLNKNSSVLFTGSYYRYGFHEDALYSSYRLCKQLLSKEELL